MSSDPPIAVCYISSIDGELATFVLAEMRQPEQYVKFNPTGVNLNPFYMKMEPKMLIKQHWVQISLPIGSKFKPLFLCVYYQSCERICFD